jgi:hypothetical protein
LDVAPPRVGLSINITLHLPTPSTLARAFEVKTREAHMGFFAALREAAKARKRVTVSLREDRIAALLACWLVFGLFLDGWNHINLQEGKLGPWLTPWHYNLYAGFTVTMLWIVSRWRRYRKQGVVPRGYGLGLAGMAVATFGVMGDAVWHTLFGIEVGVTRVISPFHLILMAGGFMLAATALRSGWHSDRPARATMRDFFPALLSLTLITSMIAYFSQHLSPFLTWIQPGLITISAQSPFKETTQIYLVASVLISNIILMTPVVFMMRRWRPPFGSLTFLFTVNAALLATQTEFSRGALVGAALVGGLVGDLAIRRFDPSPTRIAANRLVCTLTPLALWGCHFAVLWIAYKIVWVPELWGGSILLAMGSGFVLSQLSNPSPVPAQAWDAQPGAQDAEEDEDEVIDLRERAPRGRRLTQPVPVAPVRERPRTPRVEPVRRTARTAAAQRRSPSEATPPRQPRTAAARRQSPSEATPPRQLRTAGAARQSRSAAPPPRPLRTAGSVRQPRTAANAARQLRTAPPPRQGQRRAA